MLMLPKQPCRVAGCQVLSHRAHAAIRSRQEVRGVMVQGGMGVQISTDLERRPTVFPHRTSRRNEK